MNASNINQQRGQPRPPGQGQSKSARQRKNRKLRLAAQSAILPNQTAISNSDITRIANALSSTGSRPQGSQRRRTTRGAGQKGGVTGVRANVVGPKGPSQDGARYLAGVLDPAKAPEGVKVVHGVVSSYPTTAMKQVFTGVVSANAAGNLQVIARPGINNGDNYIVVLNDASLTSANNWIQTNAWSAAAQGSTRIASDMISKKRQVAFSLQLCYIGAADSASGSIISAFVPIPPADGAKTAYTPDQLVEQHYVKVTSIKPAHQAEVIWIPREDTDLDFLAPGTDNITGYPVISVVGGPANAVYRYNVFSHIEYIPSLTNYIASATVAKSDNSVSQVLHNVAAQNKSYFVSDASDVDLNTTIFDTVLNKTMEYGGKFIEQGIESLLESFMSAF